MFKLVFAAPGLLFLALLRQQPAATPVPTPMPADAATLTNPVKPTAESQARSRKVYGYDCAMCHGATGDGKGEVVEDMKLKMKDWTDAGALKDMTDGEIFYIVKNGKGQMQGEGDRMKTDDLWNMVVLVRALSKK